MKYVLNVGGGTKKIPLPPQYEGWEHVLLDIDPRGTPDVVCDARKLDALPSGSYDSVYCSHNLEHYYRHDAKKVLAGFVHVLKPEGFAFIRVPDVRQVMQIAIERNLDVDDVLYESPAGPITVLDVLYGYGVEIERSGNEFYAHKTGFTQESLKKVLYQCGFPWVFISKSNLELRALAFPNVPDAAARKLFNLPAEEVQ